MLKTWRATQTHETIFLQRYNWLSGWALRLTGNDQEKAEDLVQDAFIQFTLARPPLDSIQNLEGYLYALVRNLHLSGVRREARSPIKSVAIVNYDSAEIGLRGVDPREQLKVRDELCSICRYACLRKETSKAGSVLILRFFHGYYPCRLPRIMNAPRRAVDDWLRIARREVGTYLYEPQRLAFSANELAQSFPLPSFAESSVDFLAALRRNLYASRQGDCPSDEELEKLYKAQDSEPIECATLAHLVSCAGCLEEVNRRLGLASLSDRYPTDMLGPDTRSKDENGGKKTVADSKKDTLGNCYRLAGEVFQHSPEELHLSVNGYILGSQKIGSDLNEQTLSVNIGEKIGFVEVFSEQNIRLLFFSVEPPPDGAAEQSACVLLSGGRSLAVTLRFHNAWPSLYAAYSDPLLKPEPPAYFSAAQASRTQDNADREETSWLWRMLARLRGWTRPVTVTALLALVLISTVIFLRMPPPVMSASELLHKSSACESAIIAKPQLVVHRLFDLEERRAGENVVVSRHRIEVWLNGEKATKARRVYDVFNRLVAGEWIAAGGARTVFRAEDATVSLAPAVTAHLPGGREELWQMEPSAEAFSQLIPDIAAAQVEELSGAYVIHYDSSEALRDGLIEATLKLNKGDLRGVEQVMLVRRGDRLHEYRLIEREFKQRRTDLVEPSVFEPDAGLPVIKTDSEKLPRMRGEAPNNKPPVAPMLPLNPDTLARLELEALYQFHSTGACLYEQTEIVQTPSGELRVKAIVETAGRKSELLQALDQLSGIAGVSVEILTVAEALQQQVKLPPKPVMARRVEVPKGQIPAYAQLRNYFANQANQPGQPTAGEVDEKVRQLANRMLERSRKALLQAWALKHLVRRVSPEALTLLDAQAYSRWRLMLHDHARQVQQETLAIYLELEPVLFLSVPANNLNNLEVVTDTTQAIERLFQMVSSNEKVMRQAFTLSTDGAATKMEARQLRDSLKTTERLAATLQQ